MGRFSDELKEKAKTLTKEEVLSGLDYIARTFMPIPDNTYAAVYKAIDIVKSIDEKTMKCRTEEQYGTATMYHKQFVDDLKAQISAKDEEIAKWKASALEYRDKAEEAKLLMDKMRKLIG